MMSNSETSRPCVSFTTLDGFASSKPLCVSGACALAFLCNVFFLSVVAAPPRKEEVSGTWKGKTESFVPAPRSTDFRVPNF